MHRALGTLGLSLLLVCGLAWGALKTLRLAGWSEGGHSVAELDVEDDPEVAGKVRLVLRERVEGAPVRVRTGHGTRVGTWIRGELPHRAGAAERLTRGRTSAREPLLVFVKDDGADVWVESWQGGRRVGAARGSSSLAPLAERALDEAQAAFAGDAVFAAVDLQTQDEPTLEGSQASRYERLPRGVLYVRGEGDAHEVDASDVHQGALGTCFLLGSLAAIARTDPGVIQERIRDEGDGSYTVTFLGVGPQGRDVAVRVTDAVPVAWPGGGPVFVQAGDRARDADGEEVVELWPIVVEKAWAKLRGGYGRAGDDWETIVFAALSGRPFRNQNPHELAPDALLALLRAAEAAGHPVALAADDARTYPHLEAAFSRANVIGYHVYSFEGFEGDKVLLRNPWGNRHPHPLTGEDLQSMFVTVTVGRF